MGLSLRGATSGAIDINAPDVAGDNTITLPPNNGSVNQFFKNSGTAGIVTYSSLTENSSGDVSITGVSTLGGVVNATSYINTTDGLFSTGLIQGRRTTSTNEVFRGQDSSSNRTSYILGNGRAAFLENVGVGTDNIALPSGGGLEIHNATVPRLKFSNSTTASGTGDGFQIYGFNLDAHLENKEAGSMLFYTSGQPRLTIDSNGSAQFQGADAPSGRDTRISRYGSLLVATTGELLADARCSIDSGNGNVTAAGIIKSVSTTGAESRLNGDGFYQMATDGSTVNAQILADGSMLAANGDFDVSTGGGIATKGALNIGDQTYTNAGNGGAFTYANGGTIVYKSNQLFNNSDTTVFISGYSAADASTTKTQKFWVDTAGNATFTGAVKIGGTAAANQIDEYEEGSWTPSLTFAGSNAGMTHTIQEGHYTKIGRQVIAQFRLEISAKGSSTGSMNINTPLAVLNTFTQTGIDGNVLVAYTSGMSSAQVGSAPVSGYCEGGTSISYYTARLSTGNAATLNQTDLENNFAISGTMFFYAD